MVVGGLQHFSVSQRPLGFGFGTKGFGAKGLGPGLDKNREFSLSPEGPPPLKLGKTYFFFIYGVCKVF